MKNTDLHSAFKISKHCITSMAQTGLGQSKLFLAKGSSSQPGWIMHKMTYRDHHDSSSPPW